MPQDEYKNEAIKIIERFKEQYHEHLLNAKLNEISTQETIQENVRFVNLLNKIYILGQQKKKILHDKNQSILQLRQAKQQQQQAKIQLKQARNKLQQATKKLEPTQKQLKLINEQEIEFTEVFENNKIIVFKKNLQQIII